jgi:hypothetical protein
MVGQVGEVTGSREFDLDWFDELSREGQERVERWLSKVAHPQVVTIELTDDRGLTGNLTLLDEDDDGDEVLRIVYGAHWDDPFPEDAQ